MTDVAPVEVELKYTVLDRAALEARLREPLLPELEAGPERTIVMEDSYLDTADRALERAGFAARLRRTDDETLIELKSLRRETGDLAALHRRTELTGPANEGVDPASWPPSEARSALLQYAAGGAIGERFRVRQTRHRRDLVGEAATIEMSLDDLEVVRDGEVVGSRTVLEAELAAGEEAMLYRLAAVLEAGGELQADERSKFELAAELTAVVTVPAPAPRAAPSALARAQDARAELIAGLRADMGKSPGVAGEDTLAQAGRKVLRFHLARMLAAEPAVRTDATADAVHDMRVATRRMRAAWRVFGDAYRPRSRRRYVEELRDLATALGRVRDLDVLLDGLDAYGDGLPQAERDALRPLADAWRQDQARARRELHAVLESGPYNRFVASYAAFVRSDHAGEIPLPATEPHRVRDSAGSRCWTAYEQVRVFDAVLPWADLATLHQLRIAGKRLRYALEFFREPLGPGAAVLIERVVALQDHLGALHDNDVAAALARTFLVERSARLSPESITAVGRYMAGREREVTRLRRGFGPVWRRIVARSYRQALGRATGRL